MESINATWMDSSTKHWRLFWNLSMTVICHSCVPNKFTSLQIFFPIKKILFCELWYIICSLYSVGRQCVVKTMCINIFTHIMCRSTHRVLYVSSVHCFTEELQPCLLGEQYPVGRYPSKICCWWLWMLPWQPCTVSKVPVASCTALRRFVIMRIYLVSSCMFCVDDAVLLLNLLITLHSNYFIRQCDKLWKHYIKYRCDVIQLKGKKDHLDIFRCFLSSYCSHLWACDVFSQMQLRHG